MAGDNVVGCWDDLGQPTAAPGYSYLRQSDFSTAIADARLLSTNGTTRIRFMSVIGIDGQSA
jgi:hypothetical protein